MSANLSRVVARADKEAQGLKDEYISVEHLVLALLTEGEQDLRDLFARMGITRDSLLNAMRSIRGSQRVTSDNPEDSYEALKNTAGI